MSLNACSIPLELWNPYSVTPATAATGGRSAVPLKPSAHVLIVETPVKYVFIAHGVRWAGHDARGARSKAVRAEAPPAEAAPAKASRSHRTEWTVQTNLNLPNGQEILEKRVEISILQCRFSLKILDAMAHECDYQMQRRHLLFGVRLGVRSAAYDAYEFGRLSE